MRYTLKDSLQYAATKKQPLAFIDAIDVIAELTSQCHMHVEHETLLRTLEAVNRICKLTPFATESQCTGQLQS